MTLSSRRGSSGSRAQGPASRAGSGPTMTKEVTAISISDLPELVRLAEEVRASQTPRLLRRDGEDLAVLMPLAPRPRGRRARSPADREAFLASAGSWRDVDVDAFL